MEREREDLKGLKEITETRVPDETVFSTAGWRRGEPERPMTCRSHRSTVPVVRIGVSGETSNANSVFLCLLQLTLIIFGVSL